MMAINAATLLYENSTSSGGAILVPKAKLITGTDVLALINSALRKNNKDPMNIQNSLELVFSSFTTVGIFL